MREDVFGSLRRSKSELREYSADDALAFGMNSGLLSRKQALRLFGGALLSSILVPLTVTTSAAAAIEVPSVNAILAGLRSSFRDREGVKAFAEQIPDLPHHALIELAKEAGKPDKVGGNSIQTAPTNYSGDDSNDKSRSTNSSNTLNFEDTSYTPPEAVKRGERNLARPSHTELTGYQNILDNTPSKNPNDSWFTARAKLLQLNNQLKDHDSSLFQAFFYTQWALQTPYGKNWRTYNSYRIPKDNYLNFFTNYALLAQDKNNLQPRLGEADMEKKAEDFYNRLNKNWLLDQISPKEANSLAWALYMS